jgi:type IV pilus assembly protein PilY1
MTAAANLLNDSTNVTPNTTPTSAACQGGKCNNTDAWARFLYNYGAKVGAGAYRHITTYTVDVCNSACDTNQAALLNSMATLSYGRYFKATNLSAIVTALQTIFSQVQAVNSVFAATTLPVSINVRGTNLNQVYIGVFRPDGQLSPRWLGNLKMYKLGVGSNGLQLIDATGTAAINLNTGFVANTALLDQHVHVLLLPLALLRYRRWWRI